MNPEISRRLAWAFNSAPIEIEQKSDFIDRAYGAEEFKNLDADIKKYIEDTEKKFGKNPDLPY